MATDPNDTGATPATQVVPPDDNSAGGVVAAPQEKTENAGSPLGEDAPSLESLQNKQCPNCTTGVLYVTRYDPGALHEHDQARFQQGQPTALPQGYESGGAYEVKCFHCEWSASFAMNPGKYHGETR